mgnify:CR=1 FL=1
MCAGELYDPADETLAADRRRARAICQRMSRVDPHDAAGLRHLLLELLAARMALVINSAVPSATTGTNIAVGTERVLQRVNCVVLDVARVTIGATRAFSARRFEIYTAMHSDVGRSGAPGWSTESPSLSATTSGSAAPSSARVSPWDRARSWARAA